MYLVNFPASRFPRVFPSSGSVSWRAIHRIMLLFFSRTDSLSINLCTNRVIFIFHHFYHSVICWNEIRIRNRTNYSVKHYRDQIDKINSIVCESIFEGIISVSKLVFLSSLLLKEIQAPNCRLFKFHLTSRQVSRHPPSYVPINFRFNFRPRSLFIYSISSPFNSHRLPFAKNGIFH